jgi:serine/threonine protein kinase/Tfp pilus assembly protein PilF
MAQVDGVGPDNVTARKDAIEALSGRLNDPRVLEQVEKYCSELEQGKSPNREQLLAKFPDIAEEVSACLNALEFVHRLTPEIQRHSADTAATSADFEKVASPGILGDFRIVCEIGRGGMGVVYEAEQVSLGRKVALKVLPFAAVLDPKQLQRFKNEAQAAAQLHHQNIVPVFFVGCERGVHFYAMQYVEGQTLAQVIRDLRRIESPEDKAPHEEDKPGLNVAQGLTSGRFESPRQVANGDAPTAAYTAEPTPAVAPPEARETAPVAAISTDRSTKSLAYFRSVTRLGIQLAEALDHAHEHGVIHRDVKPSNVIVDTQGKAWIMDFGLARIETGATVTISGDLLGTVRYMSPEQALAKRIAVDHRTDVYSLGVTLYEFLTLQPVFTGRDREELLRQIAFEEPKPPRRLNRTIPVELETIILKAMSKNPAERYSTAQEFADDLDRFLEDKPIRARRPTLADRMAKWARRHRPVVWAAAATFLIALVALATSTVLIAGAYQREREEREIAVEQKRIAVSQELLAKEQQRLAELAAKREKELRTEAERQRERAQANLRLALEALDEVFLRVTQRRGRDGVQPKNEEEALLHSTLKFYERFADANRTAPATRPLVEEVYGKILTIRKDLVEQSPHVVGYRRALAAATVGLACLLESAGRIGEAKETYEQATRVQQQLVDAFPTVAEYRAELETSHDNLANLLLSAGENDRAEKHRGAAEKVRSVAKSAMQPEQIAPIQFNSFADTTGLELLADASVVDDRLRLTPAKRRLRGACWIAKKQLVGCGFETAFKFQISGGGEGFAFLVQNHEVTLGGNVLAYEMPNSLAIEFDTLRHSYDPFGDHISVHTNGTGLNRIGHAYSLGAVVTPFDLDDNRIHSATIRYVPGAMAVFLDGSTEPALTAPVELAATLNLEKGCAWVGFTAGNADGASTFEILSWEYGPLVDQETADAFFRIYSPKAADEPEPAVPRVFEIPRPPEASLPSLQDYPFLRKALAFYETFAAQNKEDPEGRWDIAIAYWRAADIQKSFGQAHSAGQARQNAFRILDQLVGEVPQDPKTRGDLGVVCLSRGKRAAELRQHDQAVVHYTRAVELNPQNFSAYYHRAFAYSTLRQHEKALADWNTCVKLGPPWSHLHRVRAGTLKALQQYEEALADLDQAVDLERGNGDLYRQRGIIHTSLKQYDKAIADYERALELQPDNRAFQDTLAWLLVTCPDSRLWDADRAIKLANGLVEAVPDGRHYWRNLGVAQYRKRDWEAAEASLRKSGEVGRGLWPERWVFLAMTHWQLGNRAEGYYYYIKFAEHIEKNAPDDEDLRRFLAEAADLMGVADLPSIDAVLDKAIPEVEELVASSPDDADGRRGLAELYTQRAGIHTALEQYEKALADCDKAVGLQPDNAVAYLARAKVRMAMGQHEEALDDYTSRLKYSIHPPTALRERAVIYKMLKRYDEAIADYERAIELQPDNALHLNNLAWFLVTCPDSGFCDAGRAVELAEKAVELSPKKWHYANTLGVAYYRAGDWDKAIETLNKSMAFRDGDDSFDWFFLAMAHWQRGEKDEARSWYDKAVRWMEENKPDDEELIRFRAEAAELLGITETPPEAKEEQEHDEN